MFRHHLVSFIDFNHHQSATSEEFNLGDASSPKVRIDDAMSPIRDESRKRYDRDAQFLNFLNLKDDDFRHEISTKVDCSDDQK